MNVQRKMKNKNKKTYLEFYVNEISLQILDNLFDKFYY